MVLELHILQELMVQQSNFTILKIIACKLKLELIFLKLLNCRWSCLISESDSFILTGGFNLIGITLVARYDINGFVEYLHELQDGRYGHGCAHYIDSDGQTVNLVAGGYNGSFQLDSCEISVSHGQWIKIAPLPQPLEFLRAATLENEVYMLGKTLVIFNNLTPDPVPPVVLPSARILTCSLIKFKL